MTETYRKYRKTKTKQFNIIFSIKDREILDYFYTLNVSMGQYIRTKLREDIERSKHVG